MKTYFVLSCILLLSNITNFSNCTKISQKFLFDENELRDIKLAQQKENEQKLKEQQKEQNKQQLLQEIEQDLHQPIEPFEAKKSTVIVPLRNIQNLQYTGDVYVGKPAQKMTVQFDTGSGIVYVLTDKCTDDCNESTKFMVQGSKGENDDLNRIEYGYGSGYINGNLAQEQICFNQEQTSCINGVKILQADQASGVSKDRFGGIIGLAPGSTEKALKAFIPQVMQINQFSQKEQLNPVFSVYLSKSEEQAGAMMFGGYDLSQFAKAGSGEKDVFWANLAQNNKYWSLGMGNAVLSQNGVDKDLDTHHTRQVIMDTGVSYSLIPASDFSNITAGLNEFGVNCTAPESSSLTATHSCNCKDYNSLPAIKFEVKPSVFETKDPNKWFQIPKESYMEKQGENGCGKLRLTPTDSAFSSETGGQAWVMGDVFLQNYYTIYDMPQKRLGIVEAKVATDPAPEKKAEKQFFQQFERTNWDLAELEMIRG